MDQQIIDTYFQGFWAGFSIGSAIFTVLVAFIAERIYRWNKEHPHG